MSTSQIPSEQGAADRPPSAGPVRIVTVTVNNRPVPVRAPKATGRQVKEAAIEHGVPIQLDFVLSIERPSGDVDIVGDTDEVTVNPTSRFTAVAPDDNS